MSKRQEDSLAEIHDFEVVGKNGDNSNYSLVKRKPVVAETVVKNSNEAFANKVKNEVEPLKDELLQEQDILQKIRSNLSEDNSLDCADLRYKISSMKYEMMKKDKQIGQLQSKIKSISGKIGSLTNGKVDFNNVLLLKKELDLLDDSEQSEPKGNMDRRVFEIPLAFASSQTDPLVYFTALYLNTCFHVINAVLIVVMMTIYYSRDSQNEKRVIIGSALVIYIITTITSICAIAYKRQPDASSQAYQSVLFAICLGLCISVVAFMARHYEDASSFVFNMIYLIGFCCAINLPLTALTCTVIQKNSRGDRKSALASNKKNNGLKSE